MNLELKRRWLSEHATIGELYMDGVRECFTLEDVVRPSGVKIAGRTAIPAGCYDVAITFSQRFQKRLPLLLNVPMFSGVRIHCGNTDKDTEGCILVGLTRGDDQILDSHVAFDVLFPKLCAAEEPIHIVITNPADAGVANA